MLVTIRHGSWREELEEEGYYLSISQYKTLFITSGRLSLVVQERFDFGMSFDFVGEGEYQEGKGLLVFRRGYRAPRSYSIYRNGSRFALDLLRLEFLGFYIVLCLIIRLRTDPDFITGGAAANA